MERELGHCSIRHSLDHFRAVLDDPATLGLGAEVAARIGERCFFHLEAPVGRVTGYDIHYPPSRAEEHFLPDVDRILDAVDSTFDAADAEGGIA